MPWACRCLSRLPVMLRSFSKPFYPQTVSLSSVFFLDLSCLKFGPSGQKLVHLAVNIFEEHSLPGKNSKLGGTKAGSFC